MDATFRITHPHHPRCGREYVAIARQRSWGEERVSYRDDDGTSRSVPVGWTSFAAPDSFEVVSAGRSAFRPDDLLRLADLLLALRNRRADER